MRWETQTCASQVHPGCWLIYPSLLKNHRHQYRRQKQQLQERVQRTSVCEPNTSQQQKTDRSRLLLSLGPRRCCRPRRRRRGRLGALADHGHL